MVKTLKIGILRETRNPPDRRVPLTPPQITALQDLYPHVQFYVQPSDFRAYTDDEYEYLDIPLKEDLHECDILMGVKEVDIRTFIAGKTYIFFSHVIKKQPHNREMFRIMSEKGITLIDYELLTSERGQRIVAFGRFAGIVGAYNGLRARGMRTNRFRLKPAYQCRDLDEMWAGLRLIELRRDLRILVTGKGRVASGILETLAVCDIVQVSPEDYLSRDFDVPVFCQLGPEDYARHRDGIPFDMDHFKKHPSEYVSCFLPYAAKTDILMTGHFWDPASPRFFNIDDMKSPDFRISIIADISCDLNGAVPSTVRVSTISDPFYTFNPCAGAEDQATDGLSGITVMAVDNLPGEIPRDASLDFGRQLSGKVMEDLLTGAHSPLISRATILSNGELTSGFRYLEDYLAR